MGGLGSGPKPGTVRAGSLAAKLAQLEQGQTLWIEGEAARTQARVETVRLRSLRLQLRSYTQQSYWAIPRSGARELVSLVRVKRID